MPPQLNRTNLAVMLFCSVLAGCGGGNSPPSQPSPAPVLTAISPISVMPGSGAFTLTASGMNFSSSSVVNWNGSPRNTMYVSTTALTAQIMASDIASGGSAAVTVVTPAPGGGTSAAMNLTITAVNATVQQIAPGAHAAASAHYQIVGTVGAAVDNTAAKSTHYMMQGGLTGGGINVP